MEDAEDHIFRDPHLTARGFITGVDHPETGKTLHIREAINLPESPAKPSPRAPMLDQHTDEILHDVLGLDEDDITKLRKEGVIGV